MTELEKTGSFERIREKREELQERKEERIEEFHEKYDVPVSRKPFFARMTKADLIKLGGLAAFFALMAVVVVAIAPLIKEMTEPGGLARVVEDVRNAGVGGAFVLLGMQFLQVVVAFIPGEVVQIAAGMMYGPWLGGIIIFAGAIISSAFIFVVVHKLGAPFVHSMIPEKWVGKLDDFEQSKKLDVMVFVLFLIPGLPKDVFTYLVPLTSMSMRNFMIFSNVGRIPGIFMSTFAANGLMEGDYMQSAVIFALCAAVALAAAFSYEKIVKVFAAHKQEEK